MPTDDDLDVRTTPSFGDPQGLLSPSEKLDALFLALTDHINTDLSRKHGEDCELCSGVSTPAYLLPVPPALVVEISQPQSSAVLTVRDGRCGRCSLDRPLTHEVTGRSYYGASRWGNGSLVCGPCHDWMVAMANPYTFRTLTAAAPAAPVTPVVTEGRCANCGHFGLLPYRVAPDSITNGALPVGAPLCYGCGNSMQEGGEDYGYDWRSEPNTPVEVTPPAPATVTTGRCMNCRVNEELPYRIAPDSHLSGNLRVGSLLCRSCGLAMQPAGYDYQPGWRSELIPTETVTATETVSRTTTATETWTCAACLGTNSAPAEFEFTEYVGRGNSSIRVGAPLCAECGRDTQPGGSMYEGGYRSRPISTPTEDVVCANCHRPVIEPHWEFVERTYGAATRMRPGQPLCVRCGAQRMQRGGVLYDSGYRSRRIEEPTPIPATEPGRCEHAQNLEYTHRVVTPAPRFSSSGRNWNTVGHILCSNCARLIIGNTGTGETYEGMVLESLDQDDETPEVVPSGSRCHHTAAVAWFVSAIYDNANPIHQGGGLLGHGYCVRCARIIMEDGGSRGYWHDMELRAMPENPCTGTILNGSIEHGDNNCPVNGHSLDTF